MSTGSGNKGVNTGSKGKVAQSCPTLCRRNSSMHDTDARGWCTETTQRDGIGREEGGGFRMGNTCIPVVDSFRYLAKLIQYCKV